MTTSVLYEPPGPRAKRKALLASALAGVLVLGVVAWVLVQLGKQGQLSADKWGPLIDPSNETFAALWNLLGQGLANTLVAAALAMVFSLVIGTLLAVTRLTSAAWYRWAVVGVIELLRGVPVVIAIFFAARVLPVFGVDLSMLWFLIIAEIVRAGVLALPKGQSEAAYAIGLRRGQVLASVLLPQGFRAMLPALISQLVVVLKDTSLGFIIGYQDVVRQGQIVIQNLSNPIQTYVVIAVLFSAINYCLCRLAIFTERRLSRGRKGGAPVLAETATTGELGGGA